MSSLFLQRARRRSAALAAVGSAALVLTACSGGVTGGAAAPAEPAPAAEGAEDGAAAACEGTIDVVLHQHDPLKAAMDALAAKFQEENPDAEFEFTYVPTENFANVRNARLTAGDIDITEGNSSGATREQPEYVKGIPQSDWISGIEAGLWTELQGDYLDNFAPGVMDALEYQGKHYAVPTGISFVTGLYYNKDMFEKYGLEQPTTWDEFVDVLQTLKDNGETPIIMGGAEKWPVGLLMEGVASSSIEDMPAFVEGLWTGEIGFDDPEAVEILEKLKTLYSFAEPTFPGISASTVTASFVNEEAAILPDGTWGAQGVIKGEPDFEWGYFPLPGSDDPEANSILRGKLETNLAIPANAEDKDCALKFFEFYSQPENYQLYVTENGVMPTQPNMETTEFFESIEQYTGEEGFAPAWGTVFFPNPAAGVNVRVGFPYDQIAPMGTETDMQALAEASQAAWEAALPQE